MICCGVPMVDCTTLGMDGYSELCRICGRSVTHELKRDDTLPFGCLRHVVTVASGCALSAPVYFWPAAVIREIAAIESACRGLEDACATQGVTYQGALDAARERAKESTSGLTACIEHVTYKVWSGQWAPDPARRKAPEA